jgi:hypothetical protein
MWFMQKILKNIYGLEFKSIKIDLQYDNTLHLNKWKMPIL